MKLEKELIKFMKHVAVSIATDPKFWKLVLEKTAENRSVLKDEPERNLTEFTVIDGEPRRAN